MNEKSLWSAVYSPKSMTVLSTAFVNYFREKFVLDFGEETAERVVKCAYSFMAEMDEGRQPQSQLEESLAHNIYPMLGFYRGFLEARMAPEKAKDYLEELWNLAPEEIRFQPFSGKAEE